MGSGPVLLVIPARYGSQRLQAKPLALLSGKPLVQWVYQNAQSVRGVDRVCVATDDERILSAVKSFGGDCLMTSAAHTSGTDRVFEISKKNPDAEIIINLQGDEPLIERETIEGALNLVLSKRFEIATSAHEIRDIADFSNPNIVKVILDKDQRALYFSRFPIPFSRLTPSLELAQESFVYRHVGLYVYTKKALTIFAESRACSLEKAESLEQLRALRLGQPIGVYVSKSRPSVGVDTQEDLDLVRGLLN